MHPTNIFIIVVALFVVVMVQEVNGQEVPPFEVLFFHGDTSLSSLTCYDDFMMIHDILYPTYVTENIIVSNLTIEDLIDVADPTFNVSDFADDIIYDDSTFWDDYYYDDDNHRDLAETDKESSSMSNHHQPQPQQQKAQQKQVHQTRHLSTNAWCYSVCTRYTAFKLSLLGCSDECDRRRDLKEDNMTVNQESHRHVRRGSSSTTQKQQQQGQRRLHDDDATDDAVWGDSENIVEGPGDVSAQLFYDTVSDVLSSSNPCQEILLNMTYTINDYIIE